MSEIKVNKISQRSGTEVTLGNSGTDVLIPCGVDVSVLSGSTLSVHSGASQSILSGGTFTVNSGATIINNGTATGFGATGAVNWNTTAQTSNVNAVSGNGYFINTTSGALTVFLPAGVAGSIVAISDYANTAATNNITITPNGSQKIQGTTLNYTINVNGGTVTLVYVDATQGWRPTDAATSSSIIPQALFTTATGGTITTSGDYKIHTFTGPGTFTVTQVGNGPIAPTGGPNTVSYLVVAGGAGTSSWSGGGAGGFREGRDITPSYTASPLVAPTGLTVTATAYPVTVGAGGTSGPIPGRYGNSSIFSTITSAGGGAGSCESSANGFSGGSGSGASQTGTGGAGNTPPVSPPQGNPGSPWSSNASGGGGGGATGVGGGGAGRGGGTGATTSISGSPTAYSGGGGGADRSTSPASGGTGGGGRSGSYPYPSPANNGIAGTANTGGGAGGGADVGSNGGGGSGIVIIRYKFQ